MDQQTFTHCLDAFEQANATGDRQAAERAFDQGPVILAQRCHLSAPLRAVLDGDVLVLKCYLPECQREVVRFRVTGMAEKGDKS